MVLVEHVAHDADVEQVGGADRPREVRQPLEVGARDGVLRAARLHGLQAFELLSGDLLGLLGHLRLGDLLRELLGVAGLVVHLAELALDRLELLAQHVLALRVAHLLLDLAVDALADLEDLELTREQHQHLAQALAHVVGGEHLLLLAGLDVEVADHEVGDLAGVADAVEQRGGLARKLGHEGDEPLGGLLDALDQRGGLDVVGVLVRQFDRAGAQERLGRHDLLDLDAHHALQDDAVVVLR